MKRITLTEEQYAYLKLVLDEWSATSNDEDDDVRLTSQLWHACANAETVPSTTGGST